MEEAKKTLDPVRRKALYTDMFTGSWQPYVQNYAPNPTFDYGSRAAALWLER